jgi:predicted  nucleic acid-binding Zn-ribbon protein
VASDLEALLALQADDAVMYGIEAKLRELEPRAAALEQRRQAAEQGIARAVIAVDTEERKQRDLERRVSDHKQRQERNLAHLDAVKRMREATAAITQVEQARKLLLEEESELHALTRRIADAHQAIHAQREELAALEAEQASEREAIAKERSALDTELAQARAKREASAEHVSRPILAKYDRIRGRRSAQALFALRGQSCGHCDTAIPLHRRSQMTGKGIIEVCEACGVLLYAEN